MGGRQRTSLFMATEEKAKQQMRRGVSTKGGKKGKRR